MALSSATIPSQSGPGSDGNKEVFCIPQNPSITGTSPSDCLVSYQDTHWWGPLPSAEVQLEYSTTPGNWAIHRVNDKTVLFQINQFRISTQFRC